MSHRFAHDSPAARAAKLTGAALGLAAIVCAGTAAAADLPSGAAAPAAQGLEPCNVDGMLGFRAPGSMTCLKLGGYLTAEFAAGTLKKQYGLEFVGKPGTTTPVRLTELTPVRQRDATGMSTRGQIDIDARSDTPYGPARGFVEMLVTSAYGFENPGNGAVLNLAYVQFAGFTIGKIGSYFAYLAGGPSWYDFYSPDRYNGNQPLLVAYTLASGGMSATLSFEDPIGAQVNGPIDGDFSNAYYGVRYPDIVGALRYEASWGSTQLSAVAHNTHVLGVSGDSTNRWGGAVLAGLTYNLPAIAQGDKIAGQVVASRGALGYSGASNTAWSPFDQGLNINGNGVIFQLTDALNFDSGRWSIPSTVGVAGYFEHHFSPDVSVTPQVSYFSVRYSGAPAMISTHATSAMVGGTAHYLPVPHLDFQLGVMYQVTRQAAPANFVGPQPFHAVSSGLATTLQIVRDF